MSALNATAQTIGAEIAAAHAGAVDQTPRFPSEAFAALKAARLLSAMVPVPLGGMGSGLLEMALICETLGQHCSATAMIFAMHQIQVATIIRHHGDTEWFRAYLGELVAKQLLIASVTSEVGVGGDLRSSVCAVEHEGSGIRLDKDATTISYGEDADDLLITARRSPESPSNDQVLVLIRKTNASLQKSSEWDPLGMRGTCSPGFKVRSTGTADQILASDFATIASHTMVPVSHVLWSSLWLGIATAAVTRARAFVRAEARTKPGTVPQTAIRLAEVMSALQSMRANVHDVARDAELLMKEENEALSSIAFGLKMNNLKIATSQHVVQVVHQALMICGLAGYKNDTPFSMGRLLRDSLSAALMVGNDRILSTNAQLLLVLKDNS